MVGLHNNYVTSSGFLTLDLVLCFHSVSMYWLLTYSVLGKVLGLQRGESPACYFVWMHASVSFHFCTHVCSVMLLPERGLLQIVSDHCHKSIPTPCFCLFSTDLSLLTSDFCLFQHRLHLNNCWYQHLVTGITEKRISKGDFHKYSFYVGPWDKMATPI